MRRLASRAPAISVGIVMSVATTASLGLSAGVASSAGVAPTAGDRCAELADARFPQVTITKTDLVAAAGSIPEHCLVDGFVTTPGDEVVPSNEVNFRLGLPAGWNQDFYFEGVGGLAGSIGRLDAGLERGYASASTDTGHQASMLDGSWALNNRPKQLDYAHRGVHVSTVAAKAITGAYYGEDARYSMFNGCSNGGRQGLMEAQRYPGDYDGIVSNAPAFESGDAVLSWTWQMQAQLKEPGAGLSPEDLSALSTATLQSNDRRDGLADGLISDPRRASLSPGDIKSLLAGSLTPKQIETVLAIYAGPTGSGGEQLAPGQPIGHEDGWRSWITGGAAPVVGPDGDIAFAPGTEPYGYIAATQFLRYFVFNDPEYDLMDFDFGTDLPKLDGFRSMVDADDPDLSEFEARGGKLITTHGLSDDALSAYASVNYHDDVKRTLGHQTTEEFFRFFTVPGTYHCAGGPGTDTFDALSAMERWVRDGEAPDSIVATNQASGRSRPLCAFPSKAVHVGTGSIEDAANFICTHRRR